MKDYFTPQELACPCCGQSHFDSRTHGMLNVARENAGIPFVLTSACRCLSHNAEVGGSQTSSHLFEEAKPATAVDIEAETSRKRFLIVKGLLAAGFTRIGIGKSFIHTDSDQSKAPEVAWLY